MTGLRQVLLPLPLRPPSSVQGSAPTAAWRSLATQWNATLEVVWRLADEDAECRRSTVDLRAELAESVMELSRRAPDSVLLSPHFAGSADPSLISRHLAGLSPLLRAVHRFLLADVAADAGAWPSLARTTRALILRALDAVDDIEILMAKSKPQAAFARWRTLYECAVLTAAFHDVARGGLALATGVQLGPWAAAERLATAYEECAEGVRLQEAARLAGTLQLPVDLSALAAARGLPDDLEQVRPYSWFKLVVPSTKSFAAVQKAVGSPDHRVAAYRAACGEVHVSPVSTARTGPVVQDGELLGMVNPFVLAAALELPALTIADVLHDALPVLLVALGGETDERAQSAARVVTAFVGMMNLAAQTCSAALELLSAGEPVLERELSRIPDDLSRAFIVAHLEALGRQVTTSDP